MRGCEDGGCRYLPRYSSESCEVLANQAEANDFGEAHLCPPHLVSYLVSARVSVSSDPRSYYSSSIAGHLAHTAPSKEILNLIRLHTEALGYAARYV